MENQRNQVLNLQRVQALESWLQSTNIKLSQVNGQRKYGGPPEGWTGPVPGARCEVFISQIPRDSYEDQLIPLFGSVGPLWEFRLMMNFSGQNRGFAYAKFGSAAVASDAIRTLHGHMIEPGCRLSVRRSTEKKHLCIGDLPSTTRPDQLLQVLRSLADEVQRVSLKMGPGIEGVSAIVAFSSHHAASMAKKMLVEAFKKHFSLSVSVRWQSSVRPGPDEPPSKILLPSPVKPPRHFLNCPSVRPPRLSRRPSPPPGFCRAVGGPAIAPPPHHPSSPMALLHQMCEAAGVGQPRYEVCYSHTGPDGFLVFSCRVSIPRVNAAFSGLVPVLPGPTAAATLEEARQAAAQQALQSLTYRQLLH